MSMKRIDRRTFLHRGVVLAGATPLALRFAPTALLAEENHSPAAGNHAGSVRPDAKVAIVPCRAYGPEARQALAKCFDLLGGIGALVKSKTVTVKLNLTGTNFSQFLGRPVGETFMTHQSTALSLGSLLLAAGARRLRFVESTQSRSELASTLDLADWDLKAFEALGPVEFENTRNLGKGKSYAHLPVPGGGRMFSAFDLNHAYADTDVMISLAKLKNHLTAGVTLSMKNMFGLTPNSLYGGEAGNEDATEGRLPLHNPRGYEKIQLPGLKAGIASIEPTWRVPRIVVDICAARPVHLAIIDGISAMSGGEGPWCGDAGSLKLTSPGVLIAGLNPVSTDSVGTAIMGYADPRAPRGTKPFAFCDNHLLMAEQAGLGSADLAQIDVRGSEIAKVRYPYG
jgi:uncharacterized protein (DUF362 family)